MTPILLIQNLQTLGLTKLQAEIFYEILYIPEPNFSLISKKLNISRVTFYQNLKELKNLGFISQNVKAKKNYQTISPTEILSKLNQKSLQIQKDSQQLEELIPDIFKNYYQNKRSEVVKFYEGRSQFQSLFLSLLDDNLPIIHFGSNELFANLVGLEFFEFYIQKRVSKKILTREITYNLNEYEKRKNRDKEEFRDIKLLPKSKEVPGSYVVVGNKVSLWNPILPRIIQIEDKILADFFRSNFELLWSFLD